MNKLQRRRRADMRMRLMRAAACGFGMAHMPPFLDRAPRHNLHRSEKHAYWRGFASGVRASRKPINVQQTLDKMSDILNRYRADPSKRDGLAAELRKIPFSSYRSCIDERQEEVYSAFEAAAEELMIRGEPDIEFQLAEIQAEKRRSVQRRRWRERVTA